MHKGITVACVLAAVTVATPQDPPSPTFSAGTKLVEMDVIARSKGAPAIGLTKEDFTLFDNGKQQKIAFFSVRSARNPGLGTSPLPAGAVSKQLERDGEEPGNTTVLLIDQKNTLQTNQAFAIQRIVKFVKMRRGADRIGIFTFGRDGLQTVQETTSDAELLNRAADSLKARDPSYVDYDTTGMTQHAADDHMLIELVARAMDTKHVLEVVARHLAKVPGRRSLIWITTAFPLYNLELGVDFRPDMEEAANALNEANVALYAVDARGLMGTLSGLTAVRSAEFGGPRSPADLRQQMHRGEPANPAGLNTEQFLAGLTGGLVYFNKSNAIEESIQEAVDDGELIYTLGFYPSEAEQKDTLHDLKVEAGKRGVRLRYRESYYSREPPERAAAGKIARPTRSTDR